MDSTIISGCFISSVIFEVGVRKRIIYKQLIKTVMKFTQNLSRCSFEPLEGM